MLNNDGYITSASPILPVTNMENQKERIYGLSTLLFMLCFIDIIFSVYYTATFNGIIQLTTTYIIRDSSPIIVAT